MFFISKLASNKSDDKATTGFYFWSRIRSLTYLTTFMLLTGNFNIHEIILCKFAIFKIFAKYADLIVSLKYARIVRITLIDSIRLFKYKMQFSEKCPCHFKIVLSWAIEIFVGIIIILIGESKYWKFWLEKLYLNIKEYTIT